MRNQDTVTTYGTILHDGDVYACRVHRPEQHEKKRDGRITIRHMPSVTYYALLLARITDDQNHKPVLHWIRYGSDEQVDCHPLIAGNFAPTHVQPLEQIDTRSIFDRCIDRPVPKEWDE